MSGAPAEPRVSVVIPHYQDLKGLALCLASLERQTLPRDQFEIIVCDNASPVGADAVAEVVAGRATLVICQEKGAGPNRNAGVAVSRGEILAFIDSDCQAEADWLRAGVEGLAGYDFVGGRVVVLVDDPARMTATEAFERVFAFDFESYIKKKGFTGAGNMLVRRATFDQVGGFKKGVSEDIEWSHRATGMGLRLGYVPGAVVGHPARRTWPELRAKWVRVNLELFKLYLGDGRGRKAWLLHCLALPPSALVHTPKVLGSDQLPNLRARVLAMAMLYHTRLWRMVHGLSLTFSAV